MKYKVCAVCGEWCYHERGGWDAWLGVIPEGWAHYDEAYKPYSHKAVPLPTPEELRRRERREAERQQYGAFVAYAHERAQAQAPTRARGNNNTPGRGKRC